MRALWLLCLVLIASVFAQDEEVSDTLYVTPKPSGPVVFLETFNGDHWGDIWKPSKDPKFTGDWQVQESTYVRVSGDRGLVVANKARHHGIGALFPKPLDTTDKDLVVQYEVQFQEGLECGGAYIKLLTDKSDIDISMVGDQTPYTIMFGPDKCGGENMVHFIIRHQNPRTKEIEEKHLKPRPAFINDKVTHLYTLHVHTDNTFEILMDQEVIKSGSLFEDFEPSINPPKEIDDVTDLKPSDWIDTEFIPDPDAKKPDDWDENEPRTIPNPKDVKPAEWLDNEPEIIEDPSVSRPADWNDEEDGEWTAPMIDNPKCQEYGCGEWSPTQINNPLFKGKWTAPTITHPQWKGVFKPRQVPNPDYYEDPHPANFPKMAGVAFELWTMNDGFLFDNILITHDREVADDFAAKTWAIKNEAEKKKAAEERAADPALAGEGLLKVAEKYFNIAYLYAVENPLIVGGSIMLGLIPIFVCSTISAPKKKVTPVEDQPASASTEGETQNEKEEEIQPEEEKKKSPQTRKRIPRAD